LIDRLLGLFSSLRLAVVLLIALASVSVLGTFIPQEQMPQLYIQRYGENTFNYLKLLGIIDLYHSWSFRLLISLLALNLVVCTLRRLKGIYRRTLHPRVEKTADDIKGLRLFNELPSSGKVEVLLRGLSDRNYTIRKSGRSYHASKGIMGPWGDMITHLSILLVLLGALVGSLGFVGTVNVYEGGSVTEYYNWNTSKDTGLGFELYVDKFALQRYPMKLKTEVRLKVTGEVTGTFEANEGGTIVLPASDYNVRLGDMDLDDKEVDINVYEGRKLAGVYNTALPDGGPLAPPHFPYSLRLLSYSDPILKSVASTVKIVREGKMVKRGVIEINSPMRFEGLSIYQTAYNRDPEGRYYSGFEIVKDPGIPLVWAGFVMLLIGLFFSFYFHHRQLWVYVDEDKMVLGGVTSKDWSGFMREYGGIVKSLMQEMEP